MFDITLTVVWMILSSHSFLPTGCNSFTEHLCVDITNLCRHEMPDQVSAYNPGTDLAIWAYASWIVLFLSFIYSSQTLLQCMATWWHTCSASVCTGQEMLLLRPYLQGHLGVGSAVHPAPFNNLLVFVFLVCFCASLLTSSTLFRL